MTTLLHHLSLFFLLLFVFSSYATQYAMKEKVPVLVNTVGPFNNPAETYKYYSLPYCASSEDLDDDNLGESLAGDRRRPSLYDIRFNANNQWSGLCTKTLNQEEIKQFRDAIQQHYIFEMFIDGLPVKGFIGELEQSSTHYTGHDHNETHYYLFTHLDFSIAYNDENVIACNLTTDPYQRVELVFGDELEVEFSYSTQWVHTDVAYVDRHTLHARSAIGDQAVEIHWLSILNSFVLVILLMSLLAIILVHVLKKDFKRYMEFDEEEAGDDETKEESGWKLVHGDVFRFPKNVMLFAAAVGTGAQILALTIILLCLSVIGTFYPGNRGSVYTAFVILYALTSYIAGYVSTRLYVQLGGDKWASNAVLTALLFTGPFFLNIFCCKLCRMVLWFKLCSSMADNSTSNSNMDHGKCSFNDYWFYERKKKSNSF